MVVLILCMLCLEFRSLPTTTSRSSSWIACTGDSMEFVGIDFFIILGVGFM